MQILLVHGYFLKGTGSNLFVQNVCRELCKMGHQVSLFCQENDEKDIDFIEKSFDFNLDNNKCTMRHSKETQYAGKCSLYRPNLNGFLPVFVYDQYEGYAVKEFISCTVEEIEGYIECNVNAINHAVKGIHADMVWTNHTVMQPVYVARSILLKSQCLHVMTVHGSCLNFAVRKSHLLTQYAREAISNANIIAFVSDFSKDEFLEFFNDDDMIKEKSVTIPAGVDLDKFLPLDGKAGKNKFIQTLLRDLTMEKTEQEKNPTQNESSWKTDEDVVSKLGDIDFKNEKIVLYYGKYLWTKGVQLLLAAVPIILQKHRDVRFILVGYGSSRAYFEAITDALDSRKQDEFIHLIKHPEKFDQGIDKDTGRFFSSLIERLRDPNFSDRYFSAAQKKIRTAVVFTGFLAHDHLKSLIACSDITVAPSIFPESFGLVAVEALSAGVIPVQTNHSGFSGVIKKYADEFNEIVDKLKLNPLYLNEDLVLNMANNIANLLCYYDGLDEVERQLIRQRARKISINNYSWESIVDKYLLLHTKGRK